MKEMMRWWLIGAAAAGSLMAARRSSAQEAAEPASMTLDAFLAPSQGGLTSDQAAQAAERTTYDAAQRRQEVAAAEAKVDEAMVAFWPKLALTAAYTRYSPSPQRTRATRP